MSNTEPSAGDEPALTTGQLAALLEADDKCVIIWARKGLLKASKTLGGTLRFYPSQVVASYAARDAELPAPFRRFLAGETEPPRVMAHIVKRIPTDQLRAELARREERGAA
jgi:hypothetical protein